MIDRSAVLTMVVSRYGAIATEAGMTLLDEAAGFASVLDRLEDVVEANSELHPAWHEPIARYLALDYLADRLTTQMNISRGGNSYQLNQLFTNVLKLLEGAKTQVAWIVEPEAPVGGGSDVPAVGMYAVETVGPTW